MSDAFWQGFAADCEMASELMEEALLTIDEGESSKEDLDHLYRALHTFKGNARMMGLRSIEEIAHAAEEIVQHSQQECIALTNDQSQLLFRTIDIIRSCVERIIPAQKDVDFGEVSEHISLLQAESERLSPSNITSIDDNEDVGTELVEGIFLFEETEPAAFQAEENETDFDTRTPVALSPVARPHKKSGGLIRVDRQKMQLLLNLAAEMGIAVHAVTAHDDVESSESQSLERGRHRLNALTRELRLATSTLALVDASDLFFRAKRIIRDVARETDKNVRLVTTGQETEFDREIVDRLAEPLLHILRNAVDHGLETKDERRETKKPDEGVIRLSAMSRGSEIILTIQDDGKGLNRAAILERAEKRGLVSASEELSDDEVWDIIFKPGFSTATAVSSISGRGVGMDVVRRTIEQLGGSIKIASELGQGTSFSLRLPLTMAFCDGLVIEANLVKYVLPLASVQSIVRASEVEDIFEESGSKSSVKMVLINGDTARKCELSEVTTDAVFVVVDSEIGRIAIGAERLLGAQQVTMKPLFGELEKVRAANGCGVLSSGSIAVALDCERLHEYFT